MCISNLGVGKQEFKLQPLLSRQLILQNTPLSVVYIYIYMCFLFFLFFFVGVGGVMGKYFPHPKQESTERVTKFHTCSNFFHHNYWAPLPPQGFWLSSNSVTSKTLNSKAFFKKFFLLFFLIVLI